MNRGYSAQVFCSLGIEASAYTAGGMERKKDMDLTYLFEYVNLLTLGICLCLGFALKTAFNHFPNKYIPLVALSAGCLVNILINLKSGFNASVILGGMISGLASTGLYEMMRNLLNKEDRQTATKQRDTKQKEGRRK